MSDYQTAKTADEIRGGEIDANIDSVLSDEHPVANMMLAAERAGIDDEGSPLYALLSRASTSHTLRKARKQGHAPTLNAATGLGESSVEATGYDLLVNRLTPAAQQILVKGPKGSGKTVFVLDAAKRLYAEFDGDLEIATNIKGPDEHPAVTFVETMSEMLEWVRDTPGEKLVIGDEWSTTMNANAHPGGDVRQTVSRFINALRKGRGGSTRLMIVGHEHDTDIASILRTQSDVVIEKAGKADDGLADRAHIYAGWDDYVTGDEEFTLRGLQDVDDASIWGADTNYFAYFEPDLDSPREQIRRGKLIEDWQQYQDRDDADDPDGTGEDRRVKCRGTNKRGERCGTTHVTHESGYCQTHRHQWNGDPDPRLTDSSDDDDGDVTDDARRATPLEGLAGVLKATQAVTGEREGDDDDEALIAAALQADSPGDVGDVVNRHRAERMAEQIISGGEDDANEVVN
ncbi:hypothetical protein C464_08185 [Halorubrum coriense DSM 10284]|uniref:Uncharacterized protein n=1 Tax=Halorubrum coriense DSM 10284 TaxID=1227466 RepID=M0EJE5_9EURY|nr:hypothetical protein [Halorubrum coriense]ELZ47885.1 hypothetical protein C464_08185 [Halorubrum coriense DSM 10284]